MAVNYFYYYYYYYLIIIILAKDFSITKIRFTQPKPRNQLKKSRKRQNKLYIKYRRPNSKCILHPLICVATDLHRHTHIELLLTDLHRHTRIELHWLTQTHTPNDLICWTHWIDAHPLFWSALSCCCTIELLDTPA